jgi:hypothetical protein
MSRKRWAIAVFVVWGAALAWLVKREYFRSTGAKLAEAALSVPPGAVYYRLDVGGQQLGYASTTVDTITDSIRVVDVVVGDISALGRLYRTTARSSARLSRALRLEVVDAAFEEGGRRYDVRARFTPDSLMDLLLEAGHDQLRHQLRLRRSIVLPSLLSLRLAFGGELTSGSTYQIRLFDAPLLLQRDVTVRVAAETTLVSPDSAQYDSTTMSWVPAHLDTTPAFRIEESGSGGEASIWIDAQGRIVRVTTPAGMTLTRTAFELAVENFRHRDTARVAAASAHPGLGAIVPITPLAAHVEPGRVLLPELRVRVSGAPTSAFDLAGGDQRLAGDTVIIRRFPPESLIAPFRIPLHDSAFSATLEPEPFAPVGDPRVGFPLVALIRQERDPAVVAALLTHWVAARVHPDPSAFSPGPLFALNTSRGDAASATALYLTAGRMLGLPTRSAAGVLLIGGRFYYHAWPEVWLGRWVPVDPLYDQFPADAAHLRLAIDVPARQLALARRLGTLKIEAP